MAFHGLSSPATAFRGASADRLPRLVCAQLPESYTSKFARYDGLGQALGTSLQVRTS